MGALEVAAISLPRETERFVRTWFTIYEDNTHWVPPLFFERKQFFDPAKNPYFKSATVAYFIATRDGQDVGTIAASVDHAYQKDDPGTAFFGFFEFVNDRDVAEALLSQARDWLAGKGMQKAIGPFNFNTNHEFGLLVDGFEHDPTVANPYNAAYYPKIYESLGLTRAMDWYAYRVDADPERFDRLIRVADRVMARHPDIRIRSLRLSDFDEEVERVREIYVDAWQQNWAHVLVSDEEFRFIAQGLKQIIDPDICFIAESGDRVVAVSITLPDFNQVAKKMNGRIFPFGWRHVLMKKRLIDSVRVFMLGVAHDYQSLPLGAALYAETFRAITKKGYPGGEASLILENNVRMRGALEKMGGRIEKTYRNYEIAVE